MHVQVTFIHFLFAQQIVCSFCRKTIWTDVVLDCSVFNNNNNVEYRNSGPTGYWISVEYGSSAPTAVLVISVEFILLIPTVLGISVESTDSTPPVRVPSICKLPPLTPATIGLDISVGDGVESCEIIVGRFISGLSWVGIPAPRGVGEFGGVMVGRSSVDPTPWSSTGPKRRFLGAVAL